MPLLRHARRGGYAPASSVHRTIGDEVTVSRELWIAVRQALLMIVDAIERDLGMHPRTAELRRMVKESNP